MANSPVVLKTERKCSFCKIKENNKIKYGPLYEINRIVAHYYCVLLSTQMKQNGKDNEGILGFLLNDINLELRRTKTVNCVYCRENNATVKCAHHGCKKVFHYPCGLEAGALSRFRNDFVSFCYLHRPRQKIPKKILKEALKTELICAICYETVDPKDRINNLWAPCCLRTWYHRNCVQNLAQSSGYFFRCATCNDTAKFKVHMEDNGIFVPLQDASWELVPNAYEELLVRHNRCDAERCRCPNGREENVEDTRWEITLCRYCGSQGIHVGCGGLKFSNPQWECETCQSIMKTDSKSKKMKDKAKDDDLNLKKSTSKSDDQPGVAPRKRKLSEQAEVEEQRKKERVDMDDSSDDDEPVPHTSKKDSNDEFYIRIPEFVVSSRKPQTSDKPHTITRPEKEDEEVDVISVDTAWLMVEEVLSRVKPAPLSCKLRFLRKKCFSFHFDPFDVREETETIDLVSDSEDDYSHRELNSVLDESSDIEIIEEMSEDNKKESTQESERMESEPTEQCQEGQQVPEELAEEPLDMSVAPDEPEVIDLVEEPDDYLYPSEESEDGDEIFEFPDVYPSTSAYERDLENLEDSDVEMSPYDSNDEGLEFQYGEYHTCDFESQGDEMSEDDENVQEAFSREKGKKFSKRNIQYYYKVKKPRMAVESQGGVSKPDDQNQSPSEPSTSRQGFSGCSLSAPSAEQTFINKSNVMRAVSLSGYRVGRASSSIFSPNAPLYVYDVSEAKRQAHYATTVTSTPMASEPSTSGITSGTAISEPSTSGTAIPQPSTSQMEVSEPSTTSGTATPLPTFQYLTSLQPNISPLLSSQSSNSSNSIHRFFPRRIFTALDSSSSDGSNDVFLGENDDVEKSAS